MNRLFRPKGLILGALIFVFAVLPLGAEGFFKSLTWSFRGSVLIFPEDNGMDSDPMPILPSFGASAAYPVFGPLSVEVSLDMYATYYGYSYKLGRAVPYALENRSSFVVGSVLGIQALYRYNITRNIVLRGYGGPAADLRIPFIADGLEGSDKEDASKQTKDVAKYFWSVGRWFMPVAGVGIDFGITPKVMIGVDFRVWFPLYRTWTKEDLPAIEGWRFGPGFRITLR
ncbi:MAG: hypothetical protein LBP32_05285 [Spirochaetaceae bacterium]|jgi:hypothetical protein|nr:hypothetical protein [Spirochaetaceae bacterium]